MTSIRFDSCDNNRFKGSSTFVFDNEDNNRSVVSYVKHTDNDQGLCLDGCLVKAASPCLLPVNRSVHLGTVFNGNSFGLLSSSMQIKDTFDLSFDFRTSARNGILAIISDTFSSDCFFIELYDSQLKATLYIDGEPDSCWTEFTTPVLSNSIWNTVNVNLVGNKLTMTCRNEFYTKNHRRILRLPIRGDLFIAGHPATISPPYVCRSKQFFIGEMRNFYVF
jgi:hypothetical protein